MPVARFQMPDGRIGRFEVPEGTTPQQAEQLIAQAVAGVAAPAAPQPSLMGQVAQGARGAVQGVRDVIDAGAQLAVNTLPEGVVGAVNRGVARVNEMPVIGPVTRALGMTPATAQEVNQGIRSNEQQYQQARAAAGNTGIDWARLGGNLAVTAPLAAAAPAGATFAGRAAYGTASGAGFGALQPVTQGDDFWAEKGAQVKSGAIVGGVAAPAVAAAARVLDPKTRETVKLLMREKVTPTPGQIMGGRAQALEDRLTSLPLVGDAIASAQRRGLEEFNRAVYGRALAPVGGQVPKTVGREGVQAVKEQLGAAYDRLLPGMGFAADDAFKAQMGTLGGMVQTLPKREAREFSSILQREVYDRLTPQGLSSGETLKTIESQLGKEAKRFSASTDAYQQKLGDALKEAQRAFRDAVSRANPAQAPELARVNAGYANYARLRDAASRQGSNNGVVTPAQLAAAVRAGDRTVGKGGFATGNALMQDLADAGKDVLASKYPDSGTAGRALLGIGAAGGGAMVEPGLLVGAGMASLPYLPGGRQAMAALLARRPDLVRALGEQLRRLPPSAPAAALAPAAPELLE